MALDITYKKTTSKSFTIQNGRKVNTYTKGTTSYKYNDGSKTVTKKAAYQPYISKVYSANMVEYASLWTLVNVKAFRDTKAGDYQDLGYKGVICYSKYHKITELPVLEDGVRVTTEDEFREVLTDTKVSNIYMNTDITLKKELVYEREDAPVYLHISKGSTLTVDQYFLAVGGSIVNDGVIIVNGSFERGICELINNGSVIIKDEGTVESGMCTLNNHGNVTVETGGQLFIERGSSFNNIGELINEGYILINNGGNLFDDGGTIINSGIIDLYSYFSGDISLITGSGSLNDNREE